MSCLVILIMGLPIFTTALGYKRKLLLSTDFHIKGFFVIERKAHFCIKNTQGTGMQRVFVKKCLHL